MSQPQTTIVLSTGQELEVQGSLEEIVKALENAARSSSGTLAQLTASTGDTAIAVNPIQVMVVRPGGRDERALGRAGSLPAQAEGAE